MSTDICRGQDRDIKARRERCADIQDRMPSGWYALTVMKRHPRKWDWVALMIDVPFDELKRCVCKIAWLYVDPDDYRPDGSHIAREAWVRIPGKHRNEDAAWAALQDMLATRH